MVPPNCLPPSGDRPFSPRRSGHFWNTVIDFISRTNCFFPQIQRLVFSLARFLFSTGRLKGLLCCNWPPGVLSPPSPPTLFFSSGIQKLSGSPVFGRGDTVFFPVIHMERDLYLVSLLGNPFPVDCFISTTFFFPIGQFPLSLLFQKPPPSSHRVSFFFRPASPPLPLPPSFFPFQTPS